MARISIDNGVTFYGADELDEFFPDAMESGWSKGGLWCAIVGMMDDGIREKVHDGFDFAQDESEFLRQYLELSTEDLIIG